METMVCPLPCFIYIYLPEALFFQVGAKKMAAACCCVTVIQHNTAPHAPSRLLVPVPARLEHRQLGRQGQGVDALCDYLRAGHSTQGRGVGGLGCPTPTQSFVIICEQGSMQRQGVGRAGAPYSYSKPPAPYCCK